MKGAAALGLVMLVATGCSARQAVQVAPAHGGAKATRVSRCSASQLRPRLYLQGATGKLLGGVSFRVASGSCSLVDRPGVSMTGTSVSMRAHPMPALNGGGGARAVHRGDQVVVDLSWSNWCAAHGYKPPPPPTAFVVTLPLGGGSFDLRPPGTPRCDAPGHRSELGVGPFRLAR
jgi:hypothetical protein